MLLRTFLRSAATVAVLLALPGLERAEAGTLPPSFQETTVLSGLTNPTVVRFAQDGRVFVAEKSGLIKVFPSLGSAGTVFADLRTQVDDYWDRGLLGLALDPTFPVNPYVYALYTYDAAIGGIAPRWNDVCPTPPGPTTDGCVVSGRLVRLQASGNVSVGEQVLIEAWCQQFPSHSIGDLYFGADGALYATGGDGASFDYVDYGQSGGSAGSPTPKNPCGDPPAGVGGTETPPTAEGGALRSQSLRRLPGEPVVLNGGLIRVDPATGLAAPDNPLAGSPDANARRLIAYGMRNPFRFTLRPGTNEIWIGDVGWNSWEEIDRVVSPTDAVLENFGWPSYEGNGAQNGYQSANLNICQGLYGQAGAATPPYYTYDHSAKIVAGESCPTGSSAIAGLAFYNGGSYPTSYNGALFFADYNRKCIWAMPTGANGLPDASKLLTFDAGAANPVDLEIGPNGDLFYVDHDGGTIRRIQYLGGNRPPVVVSTATPTSGTVPLTVNFDGSGSSDPDPGDTIAYAWDLDGDGLFDDSTAAQPTYVYSTAGTYAARLKVTDNHGAATIGNLLTITVNNPPPQGTIASPAAGTTWKVGDVINFSGSAVDGSGQPLPASALSWTLILHHCPSNCHTHIVQTWTGVASGSFAAPDHDYPSYLELQLTVTDGGQTDTDSLQLDPQTVTLNFASSPSGLQLTVGSSSQATPFARTVIVGSVNSISAPTPQAQGGTSYTFSSWSDAGAQTHTIVAPAATATYTATYAASPVPSGLVAAYGFNEGTGTSVVDASGKGNTGTTSNTTWAATGKFGGALSFNGTSSWVTVNDSASLHATTALTLEAWVNPNTLTGIWRTVIIKQQTGAGVAWSLYADTDTHAPAAQLYTSGEFTSRGSVLLPLNTWTHLASSWDGTTLRLYVNGALVASLAVSGSLIGSTGPLRIGGNSIWPEYFKGLIDEVRVYTRALNQTEIQNDMQTPVR